MGYDPCYDRSKKGICKNHGQYSNKGAGQWDHKNGKPNSYLLQSLKALQPGTLRFPGGCGTHLYDWKKTIGSLKKRPLFRFGIDEFLMLCEQVGATPIITLSYFTGTNADLADLIEYLNHPISKGNPNGGVNWASVRKANGHVEPYNVRFFEFGNEVWHGNHSTAWGPPPERYAERYIELQSLIKKIDTDVQLGAIIPNSPTLYDGWSYDVIDRIREKIDFVSVHIYGIFYRSDKGKISHEELFSVALASPIQIRDRLEALTGKLKEITGKDVPVAILEYNGSFVQQEPLPYRHCLGNALLNASLLQTFLTTNAPVLSANYWQFANSYFGTIFQAIDKKRDYVRRPNYFVFKLFAEHFGEKLLKTEVDKASGYVSRSFGRVLATQLKQDIQPSSYTVQRRPISPSDWTSLRPRQQFLMRFFVNIKPSLEMLELDIHTKLDIRFSHVNVEVPVIPEYRYRLKGKIKTDFLDSSSGIFLEVLDSRGWKETHWAHSTSTISGNTDWRDILLEFTPLHDAQAIHISIRREHGGSAYGKVWIKGVVLENIGPIKKYPPTPYLSAVSSLDTTEQKLSLIVVNKNIDNSVAARIKINDFDASKNVRFSVLNGPSIGSTNEKGVELVKITEGHFEKEAGNDYFVFTFEPHSVTALEITRDLPKR
ncbi:hypothetical protein VU12_12490 [Desulfobulbus sp. US4]|nr:hypothetical protein [Desulfobulbus sp. US4]